MNFTARGLKLTPYLEKLWLVASVVQKHCDPWHPRLLDKTEAQLDLLLELYSRDRPKELKFERAATRELRERPQRVLKGWADVLIGRAKESFVNKVSFKLPDRWTGKATEVPKYTPRHAVPRPAPKRKP